MSRAIHKAKLPFWYTEGFNPHVFLTITMPISLGYSGLRESMDVKLLDDDMPYSEIIEKLNAGLPKDIKIYDISEVVMKPSAVAFSSYTICVDTEDSEELKNKFLTLLDNNQIIVPKRSKKGMIDIDIKPDFADIKLESSGKRLLKIYAVLPSSVNGSINPKLLFDAYQAEFGEEVYPDVVRNNCYDENMQEFC